MEIGLACIHTYVYTRTAAAAAPPVYVLVLYNTEILFSGQHSFVFLCRDTLMYRQFRGCLVVIDIELSVRVYYHNTRRVLLRARRLVLLLLLKAESKERRLAVCGLTFKLASYASCLALILRSSTYHQGATPLTYHYCTDAVHAFK